MHKVFYLISFALFAFSTESSNLLNHELIEKNFTDNHWSQSHGASKEFLGSGILYYAIPYMNRSKICVCLGSGGGFVPSLMRQAQRDLRLTESKTYLIDGNQGNYGRPNWLHADSKFRVTFPEITILIDSTANAAKKWDRSIKIDYLHIDADHSFKGSKKDFFDYLPLMADRGVITFHDTKKDFLPCAKTIDVIKNQGFEVVNFSTIGTGIAIINLGNKKFTKFSTDE
jgi:hypothetical protein